MALLCDQIRLEWPFRASATNWLRDQLDARHVRIRQDSAARHSGSNQATPADRICCLPPQALLYSVVAHRDGDLPCRATSRGWPYRAINRAFSDLAPAPFHKNPTAVAANPAMGYPPRVRPGRKFPMAWYPYVGVAVPAMIARNPNVVWAGARYPCLDNWCGRSDSDNYFCVDRSGAQKQPEGRADQ